MKYRWNKTYNSDSFMQAQIDYDNADIVHQKVDLPLSYDYALLSTLKRSMDTYNLLNLSVPFERTELLNEIPLAPYRSSTKQISVLKWLVFGRIHWFLNIKSQPESRRDSKRKVEQIVDFLIERNENCLIIGHGVRLGLLVKKLISKGFKGSYIRDPRNGIPYTYQK